MSVDVQEEQRGKAENGTPEEGVRREPLLTRARIALTNLNWRLTLITALIMAVAWCLLFLSTSVLQILAGVVPVMAGLYLGRRAKEHLLAHGLVLGLAGFVFGLLIVFVYSILARNGVVPLPVMAIDANQPPREINADELLFLYISFSLFAMIPFPAFGTVMAGRSEQRNREMRQFAEERGGRLERPGVIRTLEDLQGLSLPQLGSFVSNLFKKKGFEFIDYRFIDKDKHLDLELRYNDEIYLLRLSVADKVRPGTIESLLQEMKRRTIPKGLAITSTEFTPDAQKSAKSRRNLLLVDGQTLFDMSES